VTSGATIPARPRLRTTASVIGLRLLSSLGTVDQRIAAQCGGGRRRAGISDAAPANLPLRPDAICHLPGDAHKRGAVCDNRHSSIGE